MFHQLHTFLVDHPLHGEEINAEGEDLQTRVDYTHSETNLLFSHSARGCRVNVQITTKTYLGSTLEIKVHWDILDLRRQFVYCVRARPTPDVVWGRDGIGRSLQHLERSSCGQPDADVDDVEKIPPIAGI